MKMKPNHRVRVLEFIRRSKRIEDMTNAEIDAEIMALEQAITDIQADKIEDRLWDGRIDKIEWLH